MPVLPVITPSPGVGTHGYITIVDAQGYVIGTIASSDGAAFGSISGESQFLYTSGGPPLVTGEPSQLTFDRTRGYFGKNAATAPISSTAVGDMALTFSSAPKTIMPGMGLSLSNNGVNLEYVYVADYPTFSVSSTAVTIPLKTPVVHSGQVTAIWDTFSSLGPNNQLFNPTGVGLQALAIVGSFASQLAAAVGAANDGVTPFNVLEVVQGLYNGTSVDRQRGPNVFKPFNAQAVTVSTANTPTSIWTPASGKKFRLMGYWFSTSVAAGLVFHDLAGIGGGGLMGCPSPLHAAAGVIQSPPEIKNGLVSGAINNQLWIDATAATTLTGFVWGTEE